MSKYEEIHRIIEKEVTQDIPDVRKQYLDNLGNKVAQFVEHLSKGFLQWQKLELEIGDDKKKAYVAALVYTAINLQIVSCKLFLSGYPIASGNLHRQVVETIALAILCSEQSFDVLDRYIENKYSTNKAVRDLKKNINRFGLKKEGVEALEKAVIFYHKYSHPSLMTLAEGIRFEDQALLLGASFDREKLGEYAKEIHGKTNLARTLTNLINGVAINLRKWE